MSYVDAFKKRLVEGWPNVSMTLTPHVWGDKDALAQVIQKVRAAKPDILLIDSDDDVQPLRQAFPGTPVCVQFVGDSHALPPGGQVTGIATVDASLGPKRLLLAHEVLPQAKRLAVVYADRWEGSVSGALGAMQEAASRIGVQAQRIKLRENGRVDEMIAALRAAKSQAVIPVGPLSFDGTGADVPQQVKALLDFQDREKVPFVDNEVESVEDGFFIALAEPYVERFRRYADVTARLLRHADAAVLPVDHAMRIQLWVNTKTAKALGIAVPQSVLSRADRVIG